MKTFKVGRWLSLVTLAVCLSVSVQLLDSPYVARLNWIVYDALHSFLGRESSQDVVVVAIDDKSLRQLGRWPWSRETHIQLLDISESLNVRAIGFDILFPESERQTTDVEFAKAIAGFGRVVLPVAPEITPQQATTTEVIPVPELTLAARALGHVDYQLSVDGICRTAFLYAGLGAARRPAFAYALYQVAFQHWPYPMPDTVQPGDHWQRDQAVLIPFLPSAHAIPVVSFVDVLARRVDDQLRNKIVLVGATAAGLGDQFSTPVSSAGLRMPGVELNAHLLDAIIQQHLLTEASTAVQWGFTLIAVLLFYGVLMWTPAAKAPWMLLCSVLGLLCASYLLLRLGQLWLPPVSALIGMVLASMLRGWWVQSRVQSQVGKLSRSLIQAQMKPLSGVADRGALETSLNRYLVYARQKGTLVCVCAINLGQLRRINDHLGFKAGDALLDLAAERMRATLGDEMVLARMNGEFTLLFEASNEVRVKHVTQRLLQVLQQPYDWSERGYMLPPSIGLSVFPADGLSADQLINQAFTAMHRAKVDKKQPLLFFSQQMKQDLEQRTHLEADLRQALGCGQLELYYQPKVVAASRAIMGAEALLRWHHPTRGMVSPAEFIPLAEQLGLITEIGLWVLRTACEQAKHWQTRWPGLSVAVNVSAVQLSEGELPRQVAEILQKTGLNAGCLELEVTETALMADMDKSTEQLRNLRALGVKIAVDDFGTGYSSLNYLKSFPVDVLKIDRTFVKDIGTQPESEGITLSIINMAERLSLSVVAEGVETQTQAAFLTQHGCAYLQGYLFSKPVPPEHFETLLQ